MNTADQTRETVAAEVRAAMARKRITQQSLASKLGISRPSLSDRLAGKRAFNTDELFMICEALGADLVSLFPSEVTTSKAAS